MAFKVHEITRYNYSFSSSGGGAATVQLWNEDVEVARIHFIDDGAVLPSTMLAVDLNTGVATFHRSALPGLVDMLRHEKPVRVTINYQPPGFIFVHTGVEQIGEGEA